MHYSCNKRTTTAGLPATASIKLWRAPIWEPAAYATNYDTFRGRRGAPKQPLTCTGPCESCAPLATTIDTGTIPTAAEWKAALAADVAKGFEGLPPAATPVSDPDERLRKEKGWHWEGLEELVEGGEPAFQAMLAAYLRGEPLPQSSPYHALSVRMLQAAERLEQVPGNSSGVGPGWPCRASLMTPLPYVFWLTTCIRACMHAAHACMCAADNTYRGRSTVAKLPQQQPCMQGPSRPSSRSRSLWACYPAAACTPQRRRTSASATAACGCRSGCGGRPSLRRRLARSAGTSTRASGTSSSAARRRCAACCAASMRLPACPDTPASVYDS